MTSDGNNTYQWDAEGRLISVNSGSTWSATYNAFGQRVERISTGGGRTEELFDPSGHLLGHLNGANGVWWEEYLRFDGRLLWYYTQATNVSRYFHVNALGSLGLATDQTGAPVEEMLYYPFGKEWVNTAGFGWDEKFARFPQHDNDLSLYMTAFREYNPGLGRWLTPDKLAGDIMNPQSLDRYTYALNNPVSNIDPLGLKTQTCTNLHPCFSVDVVGYPDSGDNVGLLTPQTSGHLVGPDTGDDGGRLIAQSPLSLRQKGQSFTQCMQQNSNKFSIGGAGQLLINKSTGAKISFFSKPAVSIFTGNGVAGLLFGAPDDQATSAAALTPHTVAKAMGTPVTSGSGAAADILDPLANGGATQALNSGTESIRSFLGELDKGLSLGMEFTTRLAVDSFFTLSEAYGCTEHSPSSTLVF